MAKKAAKKASKSKTATRTARCKNSIDFLSKPTILAKFNRYAIRFHDATNIHLDYAIGNYDLETCMDFIVPRTNQAWMFKWYTRHQYAGMNNKTLPAKTLEWFKPRYPKTGQKFELLFQEMHPVSYLTSPKGLIHEIGGYGEGEWFVVDAGTAQIWNEGKNFGLRLGKKAFYITTGSYNLLIPHPSAEK